MKNLGFGFILVGDRGFDRFGVVCVKGDEG